MSPSPAEFVRASMEVALTRSPVQIAPEVSSEYRTIVEQTVAELEAGRPAWATVPAILYKSLAGRGWSWNGYYVLDSGWLQLGHSAARDGLKVCATIVREDGAGLHESGMCWDAMLLNQPLFAARVKDWPGYVSCDTESGLATVSGLVCPIRGRSLDPIAVWDLDCESPLAPSDAYFMERFLGALDTFAPPRTEDLRP